MQTNATTKRQKSLLNQNKNLNPFRSSLGNTLGYITTTTTTTTKK